MLKNTGIIGFPCNAAFFLLWSHVIENTAIVDSIRQLFMVPGLRKAILEAKMPRRKLEDFPRELVGRRISLPWETGGSLEALVVSYNEKTGVCFLLTTLLYH